VVLDGVHCETWQQGKLLVPDGLDPGGFCGKSNYSVIVAHYFWLRFELIDNVDCIRRRWALR
jgi:hypothetical protein